MFYIIIHFYCAFNNRQNYIHEKIKSTLKQKIQVIIQFKPLCLLDLLLKNWEIKMNKIIILVMNYDPLHHGRKTGYGYFKPGIRGEYCSKRMIMGIGEGFTMRNYILCTAHLIEIKLKIKSVAYSSQGSHTGQLDFCN